LVGLYLAVCGEGYTAFMVYPGQFHRVVALGTLYEDVFNFTMSIVPSAVGELGMPAVSDALLEDVAGVFSAWWPTSHINSAARLTSVKLNRIDASGHYADPETKEWIYPSPINTGVSGVLPAQIAGAVTLRTRLDRGRASRGRFYLPVPSPFNTLDTSGRATVTAAQNAVNNIKTLIDELNNQYLLVGRVGVASSASAGAFEHVTHISFGRVPDTIRSRRSAQDEDYQDATIDPAP
jgi:hypothetical protein